MLANPLNQHFKSNGVLSALRDDHVGTALARLYELLVHRFYGRQVLRYNAVQGTAALVYIAQDPAENPHVRIVATAVTLESVGALAARMADFEKAECVSLQAARARTAGSYHLMQGQNPVYIFTMQNRREQA